MSEPKVKIRTGEWGLKHFAELKESRSFEDQGDLKKVEGFFSKNWPGRIGPIIKNFESFFPSMFFRIAPNPVMF